MRAVAWDTETKGLDWWNPDHGVFLITWADEHGEYAADIEDSAAVDRFRAALSAADVQVLQNAKFDLHQIKHSLGFDAAKEGPPIADTEVMARLLFPEGASGNGWGFSLKTLAKLYIDPTAADPEDDIKRMAKEIGLSTIKQTGAYYQVYRAYPSVMTRYALMDARYTYDLWAKWAPKVAADPRVSALFDLEMDVLRLLYEAEEHGIKTDQQLCAELKCRYKAELRIVKERCAKELGDDALGGPGSEEALTESLLAIGVPLTKTSPGTGKLVTNKFALQPFVKDFSVIEDLFEVRRLERFLSTYIGAIEGNDVVHTSFQSIGAWTGRMSCRAPNLQNVPKRAGKEVRGVLIPRDGCSFVVCDLEAVEMRLLAYYLGNDDFKKLVIERDPHAFMASQAFDGVADDYRKGGPQDPLRSLAKNILFALTYGAGGPRIQAMMLDAGYEVSVGRAKEIISTMKAALPGYYKLMKRIRAKIESVGYVNTIAGRKNPVSKDKSYVGLNALIQGSAADILKEWLRCCCERTPSSARFVLAVHDELVFEVPTKLAPEMLQHMHRALEQVNVKYGLELACSGGVVEGSYANA